MEKETISVIIPAYNIAAYIERCLDSVCAQTYENLEIIAVDDGSSDETGSCLDRYAQKEKRLKVLHKENGGVTSARLLGIRAAAGDWIGFTDGDDFIEPDMYRRLLENAQNAQADISHCGYQMVFPDRTDLYHGTEKRVLRDRVMGLRDLINGSMVEPGLCNKLYRKSVVDTFMETVDFPTDIRINEDLLMNFYLFRLTERSVFEDICPYHYMVRKGSAAKSRNNEHFLKDPLRVIKIIREETSGESEELTTEVLCQLVRKMIWISVLSPGNNPDLVLPFRSTVRRELRNMLSVILKSGVGFRLKMMAVCAAYFPLGYRLGHGLYAKVRGFDKIYDVNEG